MHSRGHVSEEAYLARGHTAAQVEWDRHVVGMNVVQSTMAQRLRRPRERRGRAEVMWWPLVQSSRN